MFSIFEKKIKMPKVILEFDSIEESEELKSALDGSKWKIAVWDFDQYLRSLTKHPPESMSDETHEQLENIRQELHNIIHENQLFLD